MCGQCSEMWVVIRCVVFCVRVLCTINGVVWCEWVRGAVYVVRDCTSAVRYAMTANKFSVMNYNMTTAMFNYPNL